MAFIYRAMAMGTFMFSEVSEHYCYYFSDKVTSNGNIANGPMVHYNIFTKSCFRGLTWPIYIPQVMNGSIKKPIYKRNGYMFNSEYFKE